MTTGQTVPPATLPGSSHNSAQSNSFQLSISLSNCGGELEKGGTTVRKCLEDFPEHSPVEKGIKITISEFSES